MTDTPPDPLAALLAELWQFGPEPDAVTIDMARRLRERGVTLDARPSGDEALRAAAQEALDELIVEDEDYPEYAQRAVDILEAALAAPVSPPERVPPSDHPQARWSDPDNPVVEIMGTPVSPSPIVLDVERLARAHEDIVTMYANHRPGWDAVHEWHADPGDIFKARAAIAAILARADEYEAAERRDAAPVSPSPDTKETHHGD